MNRIKRCPSDHLNPTESNTITERKDEIGNLMVEGIQNLEIISETTLTFRESNG